MHLGCDVCSCWSTVRGSIPLPGWAPGCGQNQVPSAAGAHQPSKQCQAAIPLPRLPACLPHHCSRGGHQGGWTDSAQQQAGLTDCHRAGCKVMSKLYQPCCAVLAAHFPSVTFSYSIHAWWVMCIDEVHWMYVLVPPPGALHRANGRGWLC